MTTFQPEVVDAHAWTLTSVKKAVMALQPTRNSLEWSPLV